ncbi:MAG: hypothetical protein NTU79_24975 [Planctomycetota bacterium]|nr:hypothetical protein [Planctomycetota bacterium]
MQEKWTPSVYLTYLGKTVFHCYKDEYADIPLENWYTLNPFELPGSNFEFDVRDLRRKLLANGRIARECIDEEILKVAIDDSVLPIEPEFET